MDGIWVHYTYYEYKVLRPREIIPVATYLSKSTIWSLTLSIQSLGQGFKCYLIFQKTLKIKYSIISIHIYFKKVNGLSKGRKIVG